MTRAALLLGIVLLAGCGGGPPEIRYGRDDCAACRMRITDPRFAAALVTTRGRTLRFDGVECLLAHLAHEPADVDATPWVADFAAPGRLLDARVARFLRSPAVRSPMGFGVVAFADDAARDAARATQPGDAVTWEALPALWAESAPTGPAAALAAR